MAAATKLFDSVRGCAGNLSQETLAILAMGVTVLLSFAAGWGSLNSKLGVESAGLRDSLAEVHHSIAERRRDMNEADQTLRRERREDVVAGACQHFPPRSN